MKNKIEEYIDYQNALREIIDRYKSISEVIEDSAYVFLSTKEKIKLSVKMFFKTLPEIFKLYHFHKWKPIYQVEKEIFMGEKTNRRWVRFKECKKCGIIKEYHYDSGGGGWSKLESDEVDILKRHIHHGQGFSSDFEDETKEDKEALINSACLSYRHDFGLLNDTERHKTIMEAKYWLEAFEKAGIKNK